MKFSFFLGMIVCVASGAHSMVATLIQLCFQ